MNNSTDNFPDFVDYISQKDGTSFNKTADLTIGTVSIVCMLVGVLGNVSSTIYFWRRRSVSFPHLLYTVVSVVDICICVLALPVAASLFNDRLPVLFSSYIICGAWTLAFNFLQRFSMFLVLIVQWLEHWLPTRETSGSSLPHGISVVDVLLDALRIDSAK